MRFLERWFPNLYGNIAEPSRWARRSELKEYLAPPSPNQREGRIPMGKIGNKIVAAKDEQSVLVFGPTGSGKTQGVVIPAMLEWKGPIVSTCVKRDLVDRTLPERQNQGPVSIFDPSRVTSYETAKWSPISACKNWNDSLDMAKWLINASPTSQDEGKDRTFWMANAQNLLAPLLYAAAKTDNTMGQVADWIDEQNMHEPARIIFNTIHKSEGKLDLLEQYPTLRESFTVTEIKEKITEEITDMTEKKKPLHDQLEILDGKIDEKSRNKLKRSYAKKIEGIKAAIKHAQEEELEEGETVPEEFQNERLVQMHRYRYQLHEELMLLEGKISPTDKAEIKGRVLGGLQAAAEARKQTTDTDEIEQIDEFQQQMTRKLMIIEGKVDEKTKHALKNDVINALNSIEEELTDETEEHLESLQQFQEHLTDWYMVFDGTIDEGKKQAMREKLVNELSERDTLIEKATGGLELTGDLLQKHGEKVGDTAIKTVTRTIKTDKQDAEMAISKFRSIPNLPDDTRGSAYGVVNSILDVYKYPKVREATDSNTIDPEKILESGGTLYIVAPQYEQEKYQPLFEALIMSMVRTVQNRAMTDKPLDKSLLLALDEAGNVAPLKELGHIASMMRSNNLRLITVFQDWSQLEDTYHKKAGTIVNAHLVKMILAGLSDPPTLDNLSKLLGEAEISQKSTTRQKGNKDKGSSVTHSKQYRALLTPDALRRFPYGEAVSIMGDRHPARMQLRLAYKEKALQDRHLLPKNDVVFDAKPPLPEIQDRQQSPENPAK